ncbi:hypothetical protein [Winogradskyella alexanderae]|uniref:Uncharacterized protein n=1 Tax=Winogradskyella alexanderae TaxID=2877123 RepID=A0ABS7XQK9_9FLAO|nr:hypothetical protein [Winogradskyella alexanderae]MCA0132060.1 hypothetical protein [Winogradskyella alexanderae]
MLVLVFAMLTTYMSYHFEIRFNIDLTLLSIAIIFPLVFSIRGSFRRRERALEHLSEFKSSLHTVRSFLLSRPDLVELYKKDVDNILLDINLTVLHHLSGKEITIRNIDASMQQVYDFVIDKNETISRQIRDKVFRFMKDMHECVENLNAIHIHRTPISLKAYCLIFIYIFPFIYAPEIIKNVSVNQSTLIVYGVVFITQFILISLYNIQNQLEYPFDSIGIDDINLNNFRLDR